MTTTTTDKEDTIFGEEIDEDDEILEIDEEDIEEEDDIDDDDIDDDEDDLLNDIEENEEEDDIILDDLDELINDIEDDKIVEKIVEKRTSFNILTKYEKNFIIGFRTQQIINGSVVLIDISKLKDKSPYSIAQQELAEKKVPFKVKRHFPDGRIEIWDLEDLMIL